MSHFRRKSSYTKLERFKGQHRFEHWYVDNQCYFITARCANKFFAFDTLERRSIFWDRFTHYTQQHGFIPFVTSLMVNHYHTIGYLHVGTELGPMMRKLHGSVAKLVNDTLDHRLVPFWHDRKHHDYFDGCIRDETQHRRAYRYTLTQHKRQREQNDHRRTRVGLSLEASVKFIADRRAWMEPVPYQRYQR
jgi:hypothetical protein